MYAESFLRACFLWGAGNRRLFINARELVAQIVDITVEAGIDGVPLCRAHADAVIAPVGWTQEDLRSPFSPVEFEPELTLI